MIEEFISLLQDFNSVFDCLQVGFKFLDSHVSFFFIIEGVFTCKLEHTLDLNLVKTEIIAMPFNFQVSLDNLFADILPIFNLTHLFQLNLDQFNDFTSSIKIIDKVLYLLHFLIVQNFSRREVFLGFISDLLAIELGQLSESFFKMFNELSF